MVSDDESRFKPFLYMQQARSDVLQALSMSVSEANAAIATHINSERLWGDYGPMEKAQVCRSYMVTRIKHQLRNLSGVKVVRKNKITFWIVIDRRILICLCKIDENTRSIQLGKWFTHPNTVVIEKTTPKLTQLLLPGIEGAADTDMEENEPVVLDDLLVCDCTPLVLAYVSSIEDTVTNLYLGFVDDRKFIERFEINIPNNVTRFTIDDDQESNTYFKSIDDGDDEEKGDEDDENLVAGSK